MGLLTAALIVGAGAAAYGAVDARKQRKSAEQDMRRNAIAARENAKLVQTKEDGGADIVLGTDTGPSTERTKKKTVRPKATSSGPPSLGTSIGGAFNGSMGASVGLR